jgi:hypothetical protein
MRGAVVASMNRSNTKCPFCYDFETPIMLQLWDWLASGMAEDAMQCLHEMQNAVRMVMGQGSWYDYHKSRFVETGDQNELDRMMRHVGI